MNRKTPQSRIPLIAGILGLVAILGLLAIFLFNGDESDKDIVVDAAETINEHFVYTAVPGDSIIGTIAPKVQVPWQLIILENEDVITQRATERCSKLPESYTNNPKREGHYCNNLVVVGGQPMVNPNSIQAGDTFTIPQTSHPVVDEVVNSVPGQSIAIVIDDTGSMSDDRVQVGSWYVRASGQFQKEIVTVVLYADGHTREFTSTGATTFQVSGQMENTRNALEVAAASQPDAIVLVSDEPGDDWGDWDLSGLPPVYVHSLDEVAHENLRRVAVETKGAFMRPPLNEVVASR